mmetsp:Transcript_91584/g.261770  ORF Transcript_91584/g.261770 Transcript_91584/m.261770 type:complete len:558 (-) Transcript_91584:1465-3138(-)
MDPADDDGAGKKNGEEEPEFSASAFEALERDFQEVLANLVGDKSLERFRMEYEKLHRALKRSHEHERKLIKKVRELNTEIVNNAAKVHTALKLSQEDQNTIATLRKEIEKAWKLVDVAHEKESRAKETINHLKDEISNLSKLVEKGAKMSNGQETMVKELMKTREELQRQSEEQQAQAKVLESQLQELHSQRESLDDANKAQAEEIGGLKEQLDSRQAEIKREQRRRERLDKELRETREKLDSKTHEQEAMTDEVDKAGVQIDQLEKQLSEARTTMEKYLRDYDSLYNRTQKLTEDLEEQIIKNQQLHVENVSVEKEMKSRREEIVRLNTEKGLMERKLEREHRAMLQYKQKLDESKTPLVMAQAESAALSKDIDQFKRDQELMAKEKEGVERERDLQFKNTQKAEEKVRVWAFGRSRLASQALARHSLTRAFCVMLNMCAWSRSRSGRRVHGYGYVSDDLCSGRHTDRHDTRLTTHHTTTYPYSPTRPIGSRRRNSRQGARAHCLLSGERDERIEERDSEATEDYLPVRKGEGEVRYRGVRAALSLRAVDGGGQAA